MSDTNVECTPFSLSVHLNCDFFSPRPAFCSVTLSVVFGGFVDFLSAKQKNCAVHVLVVGGFFWRKEKRGERKEKRRGKMRQFKSYIFHK